MILIERKGTSWDTDTQSVCVCVRLRGGGSESSPDSPERIPLASLKFGMRESSGGVGVGWQSGPKHKSVHGDKWWV